MNVLLNYFQSVTELKSIETKNFIDFNTTKAIALQVPMVPDNGFMIDEEMILRVPNGINCDRDKKNITDALEYLAYTSRKVTFDPPENEVNFYTICFTWDREITFNSRTDKGNYLFIIPFKIRIIKEN